MVPSTRHSVVSTYAIATPPLPGRLPFDLPLIWEASDPYLYLRLTRDNRVICGGEDEPFVDQAKRDALLPEKAERILAKAKALLSPEWRSHSPGPVHLGSQRPAFRSSVRSPGIRGYMLSLATAATV